MEEPSELTHEILFKQESNVLSENEGFETSLERNFCYLTSLGQTHGIFLDITVHHIIGAYLVILGWNIFNYNYKTSQIKQKQISLVDSSRKFINLISSQNL